MGCLSIFGYPEFWDKLQLNQIILSYFVEILNYNDSKNPKIGNFGPNFCHIISLFYTLFMTHVQKSEEGGFFPPLHMISIITTFLSTISLELCEQHVSQAKFSF